MSKQPPALSMSQIIAVDAPLLSPVAVPDAWDHTFPASGDASFPYYMPPLSPASELDDAPSTMLKMRRSPDAQPEHESLCISTSQVFDLADSPPAQSPLPTMAPELVERASSRPPVYPTVAMALASSGSKRSASPTPSVCKKRATAERVSSKDFVPPDVTGLSKREAEARQESQRKREEFETMEIRVAELEQENARLLALTQGGSVHHQVLPASDPALLSEVEQLRAQLAAAKERERQLAAKLVTSSQETVSIKQEASEICMPSSPTSRAASLPSANKTAAGLGLMVLLCALPSLLASVPMQAGASFSVAPPFPSAAAKYSFDSILPSDFDWTRSSSLMNLDSEDRNRFSPSASLPRKLEFADVDTSELGDLNGLDISFDTSSTDNGKIRVRIHPSSSASSRAGSPGASSQSSSTKYDVSASPMDLWSSDSESNYRSSFSSQGSPSIPPLTPSSSDPFLGDYSMSDSFRMNDLDDGMSDFGLGSEYSVPDSTGAKRRVRIALRSPPSSTSEGGEWEVEIC
ncbi:hypothetical protein FA13DRAFT_1710364 [Coprinellus micaceus]|uniref:BZIP domain-containing protein n=1 Tax=Coprinellus micaceus TaxID=71717 RepID=A0A4Y7T844_COPMI|nr:hypothetical protein FA13DRAFT_1710364 [Coprinellus micaceus]